MTTAQKIQALQAFRRREITELPKPEQRTAQEAFNEQNTEIATRIKSIQAKLKTLNKGFDGKNWGYIDNLDHVNTLLLQIEQHLD